MFKINRAKFHPDLIWNDGALGFFEEDTQQEEQEEEQQQDNLKTTFECHLSQSEYMKQNAPCSSRLARRYVCEW